MANLAALKAQWRSNHNMELIALGADRDEAQRGQTYRRLRLQEGVMHRAAEHYCNGLLAEEELERIENRVRVNVTKILGGVLPKGFQINLDPRGYALKINDEVMRTHYKKNGKEFLSQRDWGGYGILAPDF